MPSTTKPTRRQLAKQIDVPYPPPAHHRARGWVRSPADKALDRSYLTQQLRITTGEGPLDVRPALAPPRGRLPFALPAYVVSAWSPGGRLETPARNVVAGQRLRQHLDGVQVDYLPGATFPANRSWVEGCVALLGTTDEFAVSLGWLLGQAAVVRLDDDGVHLLPTGLVELRAASLPGWVVTPADRTCPMRSDSKVDARCHNPGGPFVSRSMEVGSVWNNHRSLLVELLGCDACSDGAQPAYGVGRPIDIGSRYVPNRYGGWQFA